MQTTKAWFAKPTQTEGPYLCTTLGWVALCFESKAKRNSLHCIANFHALERIICIYVRKTESEYVCVYVCMCVCVRVCVHVCVRVNQRASKRKSKEGERKKRAEIQDTHTKIKKIMLIERCSDRDESLQNTQYYQPLAQMNDLGHVMACRNKTRPLKEDRNLFLRIDSRHNRLDNRQGEAVTE